MSKKEIKGCILDNSDWIEQHIKIVEQKQPPLTEEEIKKLKKEASIDLVSRVKKFEAIMGVKASLITIRHQKTKWGSCSSKGNINLNCVLMLCPEEVRDYIVVHELAHLKEMNHSPRFWSEVEQVIPNYRAWRNWLKKEGRIL